MITMLKRLWNQPVDKKNKINVRYGYTNNCTYCDIQVFESNGWQEVGGDLDDNDNVNGDLDNNLGTQNSDIKEKPPISISVSSNVLDPQVIPYESQTLNVPGETMFCTCTYDVTITIAL